MKEQAISAIVKLLLDYLSTERAVNTKNPLCLRHEILIAPTDMDRSDILSRIRTLFKNITRLAFDMHVRVGRGVARESDRDFAPFPPDITALKIIQAAERIEPPRRSLSRVRGPPFISAATGDADSI